MSHQYKLGKLYVVTSAFLWLVFIQYIFPFFKKNLSVSSCLEWVFVGHISFGLVFIVHSASLCLLIGIFSTFTFNETIGVIYSYWVISVTLLQLWSTLFYDYPLCLFCCFGSWAFYNYKCLPWYCHYTCL